MLCSLYLCCSQAHFAWLKLRSRFGLFTCFFQVSEVIRTGKDYIFHSVLKWFQLLLIQVFSYFLLYLQHLKNVANIKVLQVFRDFQNLIFYLLSLFIVLNRHIFYCYGNWFLESFDLWFHTQEVFIVCAYTPCATQRTYACFCSCEWAAFKCRLAFK